jgi:hypothetical protein
MKSRRCTWHRVHDKNCTECRISSWRWELIFAGLFAFVSLIHLVTIETQISGVCGELGNKGRDIECMAREHMPTFSTIINPAYIHIWNVNYLKTDYTGSVLTMYASYIAGGLWDFAVFGFVLILFLGGLFFSLNRIKVYLKLDSIRTEFKEKELRMQLSADYEDKSKAIESRHKQLTAPSADPSLWDNNSTDDEAILAEVV